MAAFSIWWSRVILTNRWSVRVAAILTSSHFLSPAGASPLCHLLNYNLQTHYYDPNCQMFVNILVRGVITETVFSPVQP